MIKNSFLFINFVLFYATNASAITLSEALTQGYSYNDDLKIIQNNFLQEIERWPTALAEFMPRISATFNSQDIKTKNLSRVTNDPGPNNNQFSRSLNITQPIFEGGKSIAALKEARELFHSSKNNYYAKEQEILLQQITTYLECVAAKQKHEISKVSVKANKTQFEAMTEKFKLGEATETEVSNAEAGLAKAEANQSVAYANFESTKASFFRVFGMPATNIEMPNLPDNLPDNFEVLLKKALMVNFSLRKAKFDTKASKATEYIAKSAILPQVNFQIQYGNGKSIYSPEEPARGSTNKNTISSVLSVTVPILASGGAEYSKIRAAKYQTRIRAAQASGEEKKIHAEAQSLWQGFKATKSRIESTKKAVKAAQVAYEGIVQEEMLGSKTIVDVLTTEDRLFQVKQDDVEAKKDLLISAFRLKFLVGELTTKSLNLKVDHFDPDREFRRVKIKLIGS